jgi:nucleotide-binding universal stress UspA family protein
MNHQKLLKNKDFQEYAQKTFAAAQANAEKIVNAAAEKLKSKFADDKVTAHVMEGSPRTLILQVAQDWPADMIIIGSHEEDESVLEKLFGSTAAAVMWNATCSVEVVKLSMAAAKK